MTSRVAKSKIGIVLAVVVFTFGIYSFYEPKRVRSTALGSSFLTHNTNPSKHANSSASPIQVNTLAGPATAGEKKQTLPSDVTPDQQREIDEHAARMAKERSQILNELQHKPLRDVVAQVAEIFPSPAFTMGQSLSPDITKTQKLLLQDPRIARMLYVASYGTEQERIEIRDTITKIVNNSLEAQERLLQGEEGVSGAEDLSPGAWAYPLALSELDETGETLPLLLHWYEVELQFQERARIGRDTALGSSRPHINRGVTASPIAQLLSGAAQEIAIRAYGDSIQFDLDPNHFREPVEDQVFSGGHWEVPQVEALSGTMLLPPLRGIHCGAIMEEVRNYLQSRENT